jgi:hypothetical protein
MDAVFDGRPLDAYREFSHGSGQGNELVFTELSHGERDGLEKRFRLYMAVWVTPSVSSNETAQRATGMSDIIAPLSLFVRHIKNLTNLMGVPLVSLAPTILDWSNAFRGAVQRLHELRLGFLA